MEPLYKLGLREIVAGIRHGRWSAAAVMRSCLARAAELEPSVQAWEYTEPERAMAWAEMADGGAGGARGALHGAPLAVKDIIDVAGMPTRFGSPIYESAQRAPESAQSVQALERAGAIVVGKSVTTEFAYYSPGKTRNPWNVAHTPGGSSMGSAASVACGMAAGALGTQTNGSVVRPAAFCGIVGYKPTLGAVSNHRTLDPWPTLDHTGVFARDVGDAALLASVISGSSGVSGTVRMPSRALTLGIVRSPVWHLAESAQKEMLAANAATLAHAGAAVEEVELPADYEHAHRVHRVIMAYEAAKHFGELQASHRDKMSAKLNELLDAGAALGENAYHDALNATRSLRAGFAGVIDGFDAFLTPPAAGEAPATLTETGNPAFCTIWTLLGVPAITIPVGLGPSGLPLGLQIIAAAGEDERVLAAAAWCEAHLPFAQMPFTVHEKTR